MLFLFENYLFIEFVLRNRLFTQNCVTLGVFIIRISGEVVPMQKIHENIKRLRTEKELTQEQVAEKLYVTRQCISRWEQGITVPDIESMEKLAEVFDCAINDIFEDTQVKALAIDNANANQIFKKLLIGFSTITFIALVSLLVLVLLRPTRTNGTEVDMTPRTLHGVIQSLDTESQMMTLLMGDVNNSSPTYEIQVDTRYLNNSIYSVNRERLDVDRLSVDDVLIIHYRGVLSSQTITKVVLYDEKVERSLYGIVVVMNGQSYDSLDSILANQNDPGLIYFLVSASPNQYGTRSNLSYTNIQSSDEFTYYEDLLVYVTHLYDLTILYNPSVSHHPIRLGYIYSDGIEYKSSIQANQYVFGEIDYDNPDNPFYTHSHRLEFKVRFETVSSVSSLVVYEYDANHQLIQTTTLTDLSKMNDFDIHPDAIYSYVKAYYQSIYGNHDSFTVFELKAGESISLPIANVYGRIIEESFIYR